jgi:predicted HicB family RNase H-like nuclease
MTKPIKGARIDCRIRADVKEAAVLAAQAANRSLASWVETTLMEALKKAGYLK